MHWTVSLIAPRCTGMCGALTTRLPALSKTAQLKSSRSFTFVENDVRCSVMPICSAIDANRLLKISRRIGSHARRHSRIPKRQRAAPRWTQSKFRRDS